jgi:hypothetical protein
VLVEQTRKLFGQEIRSEAKLMLRCILSSQVVTVDTSEHWSVKVGAGMGLLCSGDVADASLFMLAEKEFATSPAIQQQYHISYYGRFRDDILLVIAGSMETRNAFLNEFRRRAGCFKFVIDSLSSTTADFLDLTVSKGKRWSKNGVLDYALFTKSTSQWTPLPTCSNHPAAVHYAWPRAHLKRIARRFSNPNHALLEQQRFITQYQSVTGLALENARTSVYTVPQVPSGSFSSKVCEQLALPRSVLPYRVEWVLAKPAGIINRIWRATQMHIHAGVESSLQPTQTAWSLSNPHLTNIFRRDHKHKLLGGVRG